MAKATPVLDFGKELKELYSAKRQIKEVMVDKGTFMYVDGLGEPGGEAFQGAIGDLYAVAYTIKFSLKLAKILDFKISKLECLWFSDPGAPMDKWQWRLLIRVPDTVKKSDIEKTKKVLLSDKNIDAGEVQWTAWEEGRCLQVLHVGPYETEHETYGMLFGYTDESGLRPNGAPHEIYLSDPRRSRPENLKTIIRLPVK